MPSANAATAANDRAGGLRMILVVTAPVRSAACNSCVPFHGDSPIARHPRADRRRRRGGGAPQLAMGADRLRAARDDLDAVRRLGADAGAQNLASSGGRDRARRRGQLGRPHLRAFGGCSGLPGGAVRSANPESSRRFCRATSGRRGLVSRAARAGVQLWAGRGERVSHAFGRVRGVLRAGCMAAPAPEILGLARFAAPVKMLPYTRPGDSSSP